MLIEINNCFNWAFGAFTLYKKKKKQELIPEKLNWTLYTSSKKKVIKKNKINLFLIKFPKSSTNSLHITFMLTVETPLSHDLKTKLSLT